eukprot:33391-Pelagomonas_calceolata.AAC.3
MRDANALAPNGQPTNQHAQTHRSACRIRQSQHAHTHWVCAGPGVMSLAAAGIVKHDHWAWMT